MAIRINKITVKGDSAPVLLDFSDNGRKANSDVRTYNVTDPDCPAHIREAWERYKASRQG